jgi:hypothetical protein
MMVGIVFFGYQYTIQRLRIWYENRMKNYLQCQHCCFGEKVLNETNWKIQCVQMFITTRYWLCLCISIWFSVLLNLIFFCTSRVWNVVPLERL